MVTQVTSGLIIGMLVFLIASGVTLIFGVLKITNFAHGSLYMAGAYIAYAMYQLSGSYFLAVVVAALGVAAIGVAFERLLMSKVYGSNVLMQLLVCYAVVLIADDLVKIIAGPSYRSMGMPVEFRLPPIRIAGGVIPPFYLFLIGTAAVIGIALWGVIGFTRFGKIVRAAVFSRSMVSALGIPIPLIYAWVFAVGVGLAAFAAGVFLPLLPMALGVDIDIIVQCFAVVVIGGFGSMLGTFVASIIVGVVYAFSILFWPDGALAIIFLIVIMVLIWRPWGLFGTELRT